MKIKKIVLAVTSVFLILLPSAKTLAVDITSDACKDIQNSAVCIDAKQGQNNNPIYGKEGIVTKLVSLLGFVVGVLAVIVLIVSGIRFAINGSNPQEVTKARNGVIYAVVGIFVAVLAQGIVQFILIKL